MVIEHISVLVGALILIFVCYQDFRAEVFKPEETLRYHLCMLLFIGTNITIYILMLHYLTPTDVLAWSNVASSENEAVFLQPLLPIVLAILYSVSGIASIPIGEDRVSIYKWLLGRLSRPFELSLHQRAEIMSKIEKAGEEKQYLKAAIDVLRDHEWVLGDEQDKLMTDHMNTLESQIVGLEKLEKAVDRETSPLEIAKCVSEARISLQNSLNEKMKIYIRETIKRNIKEWSEIKLLYEALNIKYRDVEKDMPSPTDIISMVVVSIVGGFFFALVLQIVPDQKIYIDPGIFLIISILSVGIFLIILSLGARYKPLLDLRHEKMKYKRECFGCLFISGSLAGFVGYLVLRVSTNFIVDGDIINTWEKVAIAFIEAFDAELVKGVLFGAITGMLLFVLDFFLEYWEATRRSHLMRILAAALIGFAGYTVFDLLMIFYGLSERQELWVSGLIGAIVLPTAAFLIGLLFFRTRGRKPTEPPPPEGHLETS